MLVAPSLVPPRTLVLTRSSSPPGEMSAIDPLLVVTTRQRKEFPPGPLGLCDD